MDSQVYSYTPLPNAQLKSTRRPQFVFVFLMPRQAYKGSISLESRWNEVQASKES